MDFISLSETYFSDQESFFLYFLGFFGKLKSIMYPCCGFDASPSRVFDNVEYFDKNNEVYEFMKKKKLNIQCIDVASFKNKPCELLLLFSPSVSLDILLRAFQTKYIICNNLHNTSDDLIKHKDFSLVYTSSISISLFRRKNL